MIKNAGGGDRKIFVVGAVDAVPFPRRRHGNGRTRGARLHLGDQLIFPGETLKLPSSKGHQHGKDQRRRKRRNQ